MPSKQINDFSQKATKKKNNEWPDLKANSQESKLASRAVDTMAKLSPTSMKITHRQMSEGKKLESLKECLEMEFKMVVRCCIYPDFYEGVRALLVDKDNLPKWNPGVL